MKGELSWWWHWGSTDVWIYMYLPFCSLRIIQQNSFLVLAHGYSFQLVIHQGDDFDWFTDGSFAKTQWDDVTGNQPKSLCLGLELQKLFRCFLKQKRFSEWRADPLFILVLCFILMRAMKMQTHSQLKVTTVRRSKCRDRRKFYFCLEASAWACDVFYIQPLIPKTLDWQSCTELLWTL